MFKTACILGGLRAAWRSSTSTGGMSAEVSFTKRAAAELSRCFNGITISRQQQHQTQQTSSTPSSATNSNASLCGTGNGVDGSGVGPGKSNGTVVIGTTLPIADSKTGTIFETDTATFSRDTTTSSCNSSVILSDNRQTVECDHLSWHTSQTQSNSQCSGVIQSQLTSRSNIRGGRNGRHTQFDDDGFDSRDKQHHNQSVTLVNTGRHAISETITSNQIHLINMTPSKQRRPSRHGPPPPVSKKTLSARRINYLLNLKKPKTLPELFVNDTFLRQFFSYVSPIDNCTLVQVCKTWCHVLYDDSRYWRNLTFVIYYNQLRVRLQSIAETAPPTTIKDQHWNGNGKALGQHRTGQPMVNITNYFSEQHHPTTNVDGMCNKTTNDDLVQSMPQSSVATTMFTNQTDSNDGQWQTLFSQMGMVSTNGRGNQISPYVEPTISPLNTQDFRSRLYYSLKRRGFDSICLQGATDSDIIEFTTQAALNDGSEKFAHVSIKHSYITDKGLEIFLASIARSLQTFEMIGCNDISDSGLWTGLVPNLKCLTIQDCINVSDETIAAICQLLTSLNTLHVQAYHVSDLSMTYFNTSMLEVTLHTLVLQNCWEITNQGVANLAQCLPNLTSLSLSGCSKVTDVGVELTVNQLRSLQLLDLSWCSRITDESLKCIARELAGTLRTLVLDRCLLITDIGLNHISKVANLECLTVRWCPQIQDIGIQSLIALRSLRILSVAGCSRLTIMGISQLVHMQKLELLELTNCTKITKSLANCLDKNSFHCTIVC